MKPVIFVVFVLFLDVYPNMVASSEAQNEQAGVKAIFANLLDGILKENTGKVSAIREASTLQDYKFAVATGQQLKISKRSDSRIEQNAKNESVLGYAIINRIKRAKSRQTNAVLSDDIKKLVYRVANVLKRNIKRLNKNAVRQSKINKQSDSAKKKSGNLEERLVKLGTINHDKVSARKQYIPDTVNLLKTLNVSSEEDANKTIDETVLDSEKSSNEDPKIHKNDDFKDFRVWYNPCQLSAARVCKRACRSAFRNACDANCQKMIEPKFYKKLRRDIRAECKDDCLDALIPLDTNFNVTKTGGLK